MRLNIRDAETCRLAGELARLTGETTTGAVTVALRERLEREQRKRDVTAISTCWSSLSRTAFPGCWASPGWR